MRKTAIFLTALLLFLCTMYSVLGTLRAQTFDFAKAYADYQYSLTVYGQDFSNFREAKNAYLANQTLSLKEDARTKTLTMLRDRDALQAVYLTALRMKIVETKDLDSGDKDNIFGKIDSEVKWYQDHKGAYADSDSLDTLFTKSDEVQARYKTNTSPIVYEALFDISFGAEKGIREDDEAVYADLKSVIHTPDPFNHWFTDIDSVIQIIKDNESQAKGEVQKIYGAYSSVTNSYDAAVNTLGSNLKSLSQLNNFLIELLTSVKNQPQ